MYAIKIVPFETPFKYEFDGILFCNTHIIYYWSK